MKLTILEDVSKAEGQIPVQYGKDAVEVSGSRALLNDLDTANVPWAIVTSGTNALVSGWLKVMGLARPNILVSAEQVEKGKPDPACYKLGAKRLGLPEVAPERVLVLEDALAGVEAGKAAGFKVVAFATTHDVDRLREAGADWIVEDARSVTLGNWDAKTGTATIQIANASLR